MLLPHKGIRIKACECLHTIVTRDLTKAFLIFQRLHSLGNISLIASVSNDSRSKVVLCGPLSSPFAGDVI
jgi:hypothetical protein